MVKFEEVEEKKLVQIWVNDKFVGHINRKGALIINPSNLQGRVGIILISREDLCEIYKRALERWKIYHNHFSGEIR